MPSGTAKKEQIECKTTNSIDCFAEICKFRCKCTKYNLIISLHPKDIAKKDDKVICIDRKKYSTLDFIRVSDYVITDYSAVAIESCILNKKVIFYVYDYDEYMTREVTYDGGCTIL